MPQIAGYAILPRRIADAALRWCGMTLWSCVRALKPSGGCRVEAYDAGETSFTYQVAAA